MKPAKQRPSGPRRQHKEAIVARHVDELFRREPLMAPKSCADCRRSHRINGAMRCEENRSAAIGGVIVLEVEQAKRAASFERICTLVAARCAFYQTVS